MEKAERKRVAGERGNDLTFSWPMEEEQRETENDSVKKVNSKLTDTAGQCKVGYKTHSGRRAAKERLDLCSNALISRCLSHLIGGPQIPQRPVSPFNSELTEQQVPVDSCHT